MLKVANNLLKFSEYGSSSPSQYEVDKEAPDVLGWLNPTSNNSTNYGIYAGGGALLGGGLGALIQALRGKSKLKGALLGALLGAGGASALKGGIESYAGPYAQLRRDIRKNENIQPKDMGDIFS